MCVCYLIYYAAHDCLCTVAEEQIFELWLQGAIAHLKPWTGSLLQL